MSEHAGYGKITQVCFNKEKRRDSSSQGLHHILANTNAIS